ncbi:MAG: M13 family metallopeptidase [Flavobacteriia bacterium]
MKKHNFKIFGLTCLVLSFNTGFYAQTKKDKKGPVAYKTVVFNPEYMDKNVKATEDFFMFANGSWVKNNPVPPSESRWGSFNELDQANQNKLTKILEDLKTGTYDAKSVESLLSAYYSSYTNMELRNKLAVGPLKKELSKIAGILSYEEINGILADQHKNGINSLFSIGVDQDLKDVTRNITYISQGGIGLPNKDYYLSESKKSILVQYEKYITNSFILLGYSEKSASVAARNCLILETKLAENMMSPAELRVPENSYNKFEKKQVEGMLQNLGFDKYLSNVGRQTFTEVIVGQPSFLKNVNLMLAGLPIEQWKDYLTWKTLNHYAGHLDEKFVKEKFMFYQGVLSGKSEMKPINERAINEITGMSIGEALGKLFVQKHFSEKAMNRVNVMVDNLLLTYNERIKALTWMTDSTKLEALKKLNAIGRKLGFPSKWEDFSDLELNKDSYLENVKKCNQRDVKKNFSQLYLPIDKEKWGMPAHMVNAYYNPLLNEIAFPAGIMQAPFFDENAEDALNYGRIGMVIGHEFTHGFDDMGSKFAADGNFINWWSEKDQKAFEEKTKVLGETFAGFCPLEGNCVNPDLTMGENIADLGGITLAYYAYTKTEEFKSGKSVNGYTPAQRFFISFAQLWKINYTDAEMKNRIANDPHSPGMYRVNGPLMNCPEFFDAFSVKEGDKMRNKELKVAKIW